MDCKLLTADNGYNCRQLGELGILSDEVVVWRLIVRLKLYYLPSKVIQLIGSPGKKSQVGICEPVN